MGRAAQLAMLAGAASAQVAAVEYVGRIQGTDSTGGFTFDISTLGIQAGDVAFLAVSCYRSTPPSSVSGWTQNFYRYAYWDQCASGFSRVLDGIETTISVTSGTMNAATWACIVFRGVASYSEGDRAGNSGALSEATAAGGMTALFYCQVGQNDHWAKVQPDVDYSLKARQGIDWSGSKSLIVAWVNQTPDIPTENPPDVTGGVNHNDVTTWLVEVRP